MNKLNFDRTSFYFIIHCFLLLLLFFAASTYMHTCCDWYSLKNKTVLVWLFKWRKKIDCFSIVFFLCFFLDENKFLEIMLHKMWIICAKKKKHFHNMRICMTDSKVLWIKKKLQLKKLEFNILCPELFWVTTAAITKTILCRVQRV